MKIQFELEETIPANDPLVTVKAEKLGVEVKSLMDYLQQYQATRGTVIPIKTDDCIIMVKIDDIILADINQTELLIYSMEGVYTTTESLIHFQNRLKSQNFIQVSKHALINIDHLQSLSDSFSGNMTAKLSNHHKTSVSRRYVKNLMDFLGI